MPSITKGCQWRSFVRTQAKTEGGEGANGVNEDELSEALCRFAEVAKTAACGWCKASASERFERRAREDARRTEGGGGLEVAAQHQDPERTRRGSHVVGMEKVMKRRQERFGVLRGEQQPTSHGPHGPRSVSRRRACHAIDWDATVFLMGRGEDCGRGEKGRKG